MVDVETDSRRVKQCKTEATVAVTKLSKSLDNYYVERLKVASFATSFMGKEEIEELDNQFTSLFDRLKKCMSSTDEAIIFCCQVLQKLGYNAIGEFRKTSQIQDGGYDYKIKYPKVDCMLTVLEFLGNLNQPDLSNAISFICNHTKQANDRVKTRVELVYVLFCEIDGFTEDNISFILQLADLFNRRRMFNSYIARRKEAKKMEEEKKKQLSKKKELPKDVMQDSGVLRSVEKTGVEEQTPNEEHTLTNKEQAPKEDQTPPDDGQTPPTQQSDTGDQHFKPVPTTGGLVNSDCTTLSADKSATTDFSYTFDAKTETGEACQSPQMVITSNKNNNPIRETPQPTKAINVQELMKIFQSEGQSVELRWYQLGERLNVPKDALDNVRELKRSDSYKLEETLYKWTESDCRMWDSLIQALSDLELEQVAVKIKDYHEMC